MTRLSSGGNLPPESHNKANHKADAPDDSSLLESFHICQKLLMRAACGIVTEIKHRHNVSSMKLR